MNAKQKRIQARLQQIKDRSAQENAAKKATPGYDLAEEAAELGLEILEGVK